MSPMEAMTGRAACSLNRDNFSTPRHWILTDGYNVTITAQLAGRAPTAGVTMSVREFNRLIAWYTKPQRVQKRLVGPRAEEV